MAATRGDAWKKLMEHKKKMEATTMREMFGADPERFNKMNTRIIPRTDGEPVDGDYGEILLDYSKNIASEETMSLLEQVATDAKVFDWSAKMFSGEKINCTEDRAVLHIALRNRPDKPILVDGKV